MRAGRRVAALSERDLAVLALERDWGQAPEVMSAKLAIARSDFGLSEPAYALVVSSLIDDPAAASHDPATIRRLREVRESRRATLAADGD